MDAGARSTRVALGPGPAPEQAVLCLGGELRPFALVGDWLGGMAVLGSRPVRVARPDEDPFELLDSALPRVSDGPARVGGGWVGWLGYGLGALVESLPPSPPAPVPRDAFSLAYYDHVALFDGERWWFEALVTEGRESVLRERLGWWRSRLTGSPPTHAPPTHGIATTDPAGTRFELAANGAAGHTAAVRECRERIAAGELLQANLCLRLEAAFDGNPVQLFARGLAGARPRFGALVDDTVSLSPERFLRRRGRVVLSEPIKGTRPRTGGEGEQQAALSELLASAKDAAEHVMIVDLIRNDLGRVSRYGSVAVEPPRPEAHSGVWHLVSTVRGRLRDGVGDGELLRATFPPGSVTGAPKVQAMKVIAELEATRREAYTGAIGILSPLAGLDLSVAIRTFELGRGRIWLGAGGGIVADSDPDHELDEALAKAAGPIAAIGGRVAADTTRRRATAVGAGRALAHGRRPDPRRGLMETLLVAGGRPVRAVEHLARLTASLEWLYGTGLPVNTAALIAEAAARAPGRARLQVLAGPGGSMAIGLVAAPRVASPSPRRLVPFVLPGGLGAHKWRDRRLLDALAATLPPMEVPLIVDSDGLVLEAAHANVWIREGGTLVTPPADGRILPGVTRAAMIAAEPSARTEPVSLERLRAADQVLLTSSIAGPTPARL